MSYNFAYRTGVGPLLVFCAFLGACSKPDSAVEPLRAVRVLTIGESGLTDRAEFAAELSPRAESLSKRPPPQLLHVGMAPESMM